MLKYFVCKVSWTVLVSPLNATEIDIGEPGKKHYSRNCTKTTFSALKLHLTLHGETIMTKQKL